MPVYDARQRRLVVRVVYDGAVQSGKTTNLRQVCAAFTTQRRGPLVVPEEIAGRTLYFDWVHLDGGLVAGHALRCQLVTVPGQTVLSRRRRRILDGADAVVFVCESTARGVRAARPLLTDLLAVRSAREWTLPLVVQANKQDLEGALGVSDLRQSLRLADDVRVVPASAGQGSGVKETLVLAIRAAAENAQRALLERGLDALEGPVEDAAGLHEALIALDAAAPEGALSLALVAAQRLLEHEDARAADPPSDDAAAPAAVDPAEAAPAEPAAATAPATTEAAAPVAAAHAEPPLPVPEVPSGHVWPAARGREILRGLPLDVAARRDDLVGRQGVEDGSGTSDLLIYQAGAWCLKTSRRRRFDDVDAARAAILDLARRKLLLGALLPPDTVIVLRGDGSALWLWTVCPWLRTLRACMAEADARGDEAALGAELRAFAGAAVDALRLAARQGVALDVHPSNFARSPTGVCYLDDDAPVGRRLPTAAHALLRRVEEYAHRPAAIEIYVAALEATLAARLRASEVETIGLREAFDATPARHPFSEHARSRLARALWRCA